ncbi:hypothetical protein JTB14_010402 [Gonioctena quinquepunctata]|nr:hypothetical protein JTB14_010402 [Gonioctena quinquepunctata]
MEKFNNAETNGEEMRIISGKRHIATDRNGKVEQLRNEEEIRLELIVEEDRLQKTGIDILGKFRHEYTPKNRHFNANKILTEKRNMNYTQTNGKVKM